MNPTPRNRANPRLSNLVYQGGRQRKPVDQDAVRRKAAHHRANPNDITTWHEVEDLQPRVKQRLKLGGWTAVHIRVQGFRFMFGDNPAGILETIPPKAAYGWPDWWCFHPQDDTVLVLELKKEGGIVSPEQKLWLARLARYPGFEVALIRPRDVVGDDVLQRRLVLHERCPQGCQGTGATCSGWCRCLVRLTG